MRCFDQILRSVTQVRGNRGVPCLDQGGAERGLHLSLWRPLRAGLW